MDALTHLNFAFAYVDPDSFTVVTMDPDTEASLYQDATNVKQYKSDLQVFVSIGGWTYELNLPDDLCIIADHILPAFPTTAQVLSRSSVTSRQPLATVKSLPTMLFVLWTNMVSMVLISTGEYYGPEYPSNY